MKGANGRVVGEAIFLEAEGAGGVEVTLIAHDLPPGIHGVHVHDVRRCDPPNFTSAGGHFYPDGKKHGLENSDGPHNGDLPDLTVAADGTGILNAEDPRLQDLGEDQNLFEGDRVTLVIHAGPDDEATDLSGNSGSHIACGVMIHD